MKDVIAITEREKVINNFDYSLIIYRSSDLLFSSSNDLLFSSGKMEKKNVGKHNVRSVII